MRTALVVVFCVLATACVTLQLHPVDPDVRPARAPATVTVPTGQSPLAWAAYGDGAGNIIVGNERPFVMVSQGASSPTQTRFVGSTPMHLRYDAGTTVCFGVSRYPATGSLYATLGYTGYTIDYP